MNMNVIQQLTCFMCLSGFNLFKTFFENVNLCDHRLKRQGTQLVSPHSHVSLHFVFYQYFLVSESSNALNICIELNHILVNIYI